MKDNYTIKLYSNRLLRLTGLIRDNKIRLSIQDGPYSLSHDVCQLDLNNTKELVQRLQQLLSDLEKQ